MTYFVVCHAMSINGEAASPFIGTNNGFVTTKRRRSGYEEEEMNENSDRCNRATSIDFWHCDRALGRRFLPINASDFVFHSENFRPNGETLYIPLREDTLINTQSVEQFTFTEGSFFIGDEESRFSRTAQGIPVRTCNYKYV